ncbi:MAG: methylated-DNA--[protein]-cysteine S-methyltransferase [Culicoidibacterales bacterium]
MDNYRQLLNTPVGRICVIASETAVTQIYFLQREEQSTFELSNHITELAIQQLYEYFTHQRDTFTFPVYQTGTKFQQQVWAAVQAIPYGEMKSYRDIGTQIENPKAVRAIGQANKKNKLLIVVPCHRVIAHDGSLGGYAYGNEIKQYLLALEGNRMFVDKDS